MKAPSPLLLVLGLGWFSAVAMPAKEIPAQVFAAGPDWQPIEWNPGRIVPGSALDFSRFLDAPAGKQGKVVIRDGQFVFAQTPNRPVRLYGTDITHALPYLDKARCEQLADSLAASGYNAVRLHNYTFAKGVLKEPGSSEFSPEAEDQLDYFFFCLKKRGIYFTLPINSWGFFKAGDVTDIPEFRDRAFRFESNGLLPVSQDAQRWFKEYARRLLGHVNRYTGLALKDDPALLSVELANEDSLHAVLGQYPKLVGIYRRLTADELRAHSGREPTAEETERALPHFVLRAQEKYVTAMTAFLRELGLEQPVTSLNFRDNQVYALPRSLLDYVDVHSYWALYHVVPGAKDAYQQNWSNPNRSGWSSYLGPAAARLFGKPYMTSEFNGCYPTPFWSFTGPVEAILAGNQGWNGVFRCGQEADPASFFTASPIRRISVGNSPIMLFSERIGALLFAQGEVHPLPIKLPFVITPDYLRRNLTLAGGPRYPTVYQRLAFRYQLGTVLLNGKESLDEFPALVAPADLVLPDSLRDRKVFRVSDDLETTVNAFFEGRPSSQVPRLQLDQSSGLARISTPRSETFLLPEETASADGENMSVAGNKSVAVCFAASLDGRRLPESKHLLVLYLTDLKNTGTEIEPEAGKPGSVIIRNPGHLPLLLRQGTVELTFRHETRTLPEIWALQYDGTRASKMEPTPTKSGFSFVAPAQMGPAVFAAYEIKWER